MNMRISIAIDPYSYTVNTRNSVPMSNSLCTTLYSFPDQGLELVNCAKKSSLPTCICIMQSLHIAPVLICTDGRRLRH